jgi:(E)-2-((N-methylformamido)methylene)succinate hydrolase
MIEVIPVSSTAALPLLVPSADFRRTCAKYATGICIVTCTGRDGAPVGLTVNSFTSVSCEPPIVLFCIDHRCALLEEFRAARAFGISVLSADQQHVSTQFACNNSDRFRGIAWRPGEGGAPLLEGSLAHFECIPTQILDVGDHAVIFGEVVRTTCFSGEPLIYFNSSYRTVGC